MDRVCVSGRTTTVIVQPSGRGTIGQLVVVIIIGLLAGSLPVGAQVTPPGGTTLSGIVYDSIGGRMLAGASVELVSAEEPSARPFTARSDGSGRYSLTGLPHGRYLAGFFHPALDTLGLERTPRPVLIQGATQRLDLATPSVRTVTTAICPASARSDSTGLLIGHVRLTEEQTPLGGASVAVEWTETVVGSAGIFTRIRLVTAHTEAPGWFAMCGLPGDAALQARAFNGSDSSGYIDIEVPPNGLRHIGFFIGGATSVIIASADTAAGQAEPERAWRGRARLTGTVVDHDGRPVAGAHALVWGTKLDGVTNAQGAFTLDGLPGGTHTVEVRVIGHTPVTSVVHLAESRPANVAIALAKPAQQLSTVTVRGELVYSRNLADFNRRRRSGFGQFRMPDEIARRGPSIPLSRLLHDFTGLFVYKTGGGPSRVTMRRSGTHAGIEECEPSLYVDGRLDRVRDYDIYYSDQIAAIEVYREHNRPFELVDFTNACGAVAIWTRPAPAKPGK